LHYLVQPAGPRLCARDSVLAWALFFGAVFTFLNIQGIKTSARVNTLLAAGMGAVVAVFFMAVARYIFRNPHDGGAFSRVLFMIRNCGIRRRCWRRLRLQVLSYIGFDGISTLSEEARILGGTFCSRRYSPVS